MEENRSLKNFIYDSVFEDIVQGVYPVNTILNERVLIEKYNVSKTPVREALVELCNEGLLKNIPRYGYQLVPITLKELSDIQDLRLILELGALEKVIGHITEDQLAQLVANVEKAQEIASEKDIKKHWLHNISFHLLLCSFCGNEFIYRDLEKVLLFCSRGANQYFSNTWSRSKIADSIDHLQLIDAIRQKDLVLAKETLTKDICSMRDVILNS
jgi:DNA-binding GntR family transcriptional regulator